MVKFIHYSEPLEESSDSAVARFVGPTICCIGWIPFFAKTGDLPPSSPYVGLSISSKNLLTFNKSAFDFMFLSGNNCPGVAYSDVMSQLNMAEFRGVIGLDHVHALVDKNNHFVGVEFDRLGAVGATPIRFSGSTIKRFTGYGDGDYVVFGKPSEHITLVTWHSFKMSLTVDLANFLLTKARATSASISISYTFYRDGSVRVSVKSSAVPSVQLVLNWLESKTFHDMLTASSDSIKGFFAAGSCATAPTYNINTLFLEASKEFL